MEFAWQARYFRLSKGPDVRSGVVWCRSGAAWAPGLGAWNLRGRRGTSGSPRGLMYALASSGVVPGLLGLRGSVRGICLAGAALQAQHFRLNKGPNVRSGVVWCRSGAAWAPGLCAWVEFAWQARHFRLSKGPDVRSGVVWCRSGAAWAPGLCAWVEFAWQARHFRLSKGPDVRSVRGICVAGAALRALQGRDVRSGVVWCRSGAAWAPGLCAWNLRGNWELTSTVYRQAAWAIKIMYSTHAVLARRPHQLSRAFRRGHFAC